MDRLQEMEVFVAVADAGSFVGGARQRHVSPPAVTRAIASLEARLGVQLLVRTTRALRLTDAGARFLETTRRMLVEIETAENELVGEIGVLSGTLTLSASMTFGRYVLAPVVAGFLDAHAQIDVAMLQVERIVDLIDEGVDLAVRIGPLPDSTLMARRVGSVRRMLVASPDYVASHGAPDTPSGLADHQVIRLPV